MGRILSYALFRSPDAIYWRNDSTEDKVSAYARYLPAMIRAHHAIWTGYELRIHHDDAVRSHPYFPVLERMHDHGLLRLIACGAAQALTLSMLWRMKPLFDEDDHLVLTCDMDALPLLRLRLSVEEFATSERAVMLVHGCESHNGAMGGGFGARGGVFRRLIGRSSWDGFVGLGHNVWQYYAADEEFLRTVIWPMIAGSSIIFRNESTSLNLRCADVRRFPSTLPDNLLPEVREHGNEFAPYIGSAGYSLEAAFSFYNSLPLDAIRSIRECETGVDLRAVMRI